MFLIRLLEKEKISYAATSTTGRDGTYKFKFEHDETDDMAHEDNPEQYEALPAATTVLITFPLKGHDQSIHLYSSYVQNHDPDNIPYQFIQLGSTGIFSVPNQDLWVTRHSKYDETNDRAIAEDELRQLGGCVLNLSGLWGGARQPRNWIDRVASTKDKLKEKTSLHMIHGTDVARAILAVHRNFRHAVGQRFVFQLSQVFGQLTDSQQMLTDLLVYDWWAVILGFSGEDDIANENEERANTQIKWIGELMTEKKVKALPRSMEQLGRCYDSCEFWTTFGLMPVRARI
jgi:hypothetical protein